MTLPVASTHLAYRGDVRHIVGEVKGRNHLGEWFTAVDATYDAATDTTRVGFAIGIHDTSEISAGVENRERWQRFLDALNTAREAAS